MTADGDYGLLMCCGMWYLLTESATLLKISPLETLIEYGGHLKDQSGQFYHCVSKLIPEPLAINMPVTHGLQLICGPALMKRNS